MAVKGKCCLLFIFIGKTERQPDSFCDIFIHMGFEFCAAWYITIKM